MHNKLYAIQVKQSMAIKLNIIEGTIVITIDFKNEIESIPFSGYRFSAYIFEIAMSEIVSLQMCPDEKITILNVVDSWNLNNGISQGNNDCLYLASFGFWYFKDIFIKSINTSWQHTFFGHLPKLH